MSGQGIDKEENIFDAGEAFKFIEGKTGRKPPLEWLIKHDMGRIEREDVEGKRITIKDFTGTTLNLSYFLKDNVKIKGLNITSSTLEYLNVGNFRMREDEGRYDGFANFWNEYNIGRSYFFELKALNLQVIEGNMSHCDGVTLSLKYHSKLASLPRSIHCAWLDISGTKIKTLPQGLKVGNKYGGVIDVRNTPFEQALKCSPFRVADHITDDLCGEIGNNVVIKTSTGEVRFGEHIYFKAKAQSKALQEGDKERKRLGDG